MVNTARPVIGDNVLHTNICCHLQLIKQTTIHTARQSDIVNGIVYHEAC